MDSRIRQASIDIFPYQSLHFQLPYTQSSSTLPTTLPLQRWKKDGIDWPSEVIPSLGMPPCEKPEGKRVPRKSHRCLSSLGTASLQCPKPLSFQLPDMWNHYLFPLCHTLMLRCLLFVTKSNPIRLLCFSRAESSIRGYFQRTETTEVI